MSKIDDLDFADMLYQNWAKTTDAERSFWGVSEKDEFDFVKIYAVGEGVTELERGKLVASELDEQDAGFITAVHGCFGDLIKRWHDALDTAERMEIERDNVVAELGQAYLEIEQLKAGRA